MAAYCDYDFYKNEYKGAVIAAEEIEQALQHASFSVDQATYYRIGDLSEWPEFTQRQIKLACCSQADYDYQTQEMDELERFLDSVGSYTIGDVSLSGGGAGNKTAQEMPLEKHYGLCSKAIKFLMPTGLLDRRLH